MTRLMLGCNNEPSLLVDIQKETDQGFEFWVVNGAWEGVFTYTDIDTGSVFINFTKDTLDNVQVLCDNQDRLRGNYQSVFENYSNPDYVAPKPKEPVHSDIWDDDIAF